MRRIGLCVTLAAVLAPQLAQSQSVDGRFRWNNAGSSFAWYWRTSAGVNKHVLGGDGYNASFRFTSAAPAPSWQWPPHAVGGTGFGPGVDVYCVDFLHTAKTGSTGYDAYFTKATAVSFANPSQVRTRSSDLSRYLKAAWLITKMETYGLTTTADKMARADIHASIWWIMAGEPTQVWNGVGSTSLASSFVPVGTTGGVTSWIDQANANWQSVDGSEWTIVTDQCVSTSGNAGAGSAATDTCSQEFLAHNVVPEPATLLLLGTGLLATLAMGGVFRRPDA